MVAVRQAGVEDIPRLASFVLAAWGEAGPTAVGWTGASEEAIQTIASEGFLRELLTDPDATVFVAEEGGDILGFAISRKIDAAAVELAGIIVREGRTGRGFGSALLERAKASASRAGYRRMVVKTEAFNERALGFYQRNGFSLGERKREDVRGVHVDLAVLHLDLT